MRAQVIIDCVPMGRRTQITIEIWDFDHGRREGPMYTRAWNVEGSSKVDQTTLVDHLAYIAAQVNERAQAELAHVHARRRTDP